MARWRLVSIALVVTTFFIIATVNAQRLHHHDSITQLLKDPERLEIVHAMLKKYKAKIMKSPFGDPVNSMGPPVWVGNFPPSLPNDQEFFLEQNTNDTFINEPTKRNGHHNHRLVRSRNEPLSEEICKTNRYWKQINDTRDIYGQEVRIVHSSEYRQFAFVYECIREGEHCTGISEHLQSTCEMRPGWANMLHVKLTTVDTSLAPQWGYVAVPHHCACRIYPRVNPFIP
ncbi:uncharacterized protein LOC124188339 isoform X1 [Daphnia pulex]|uniref:uncharacterized protein LOC124188339 isoform X1 n=1 Tax=Daphnia pulex TaxID=6669 RepID=UPI001EDE134B|nr:uncharacterized protein LOC124188339 isoform X1 [Daphnia pulex]